jgi:hypothetical protein
MISSAVPHTPQYFIVDLLDLPQVEQTNLVLTTTGVFTK